jgi:ribosomal protein S1/(E)-4-hydroxy-3-methyl-but-2-enyl pyrophosphate reductase
MVAKHAGFCFGVKRAVDAVYNNIEKYDHLYTYGPLIHNESVVKKLTDLGVPFIESFDEIEEIKNTAIIIRSHGVSPKIFEKISELGIKAIDATCPFVTRIQQKAFEADKQGRNVIIIGKDDHPEVVGINGWANDHAYVLNAVSDVKNLPELTKPIVVAQTTIEFDMWNDITQKIKTKYKDAELFMSICETTLKRQKEAMELSKKCDKIIVVGGKNSSNTQKLYSICMKYCKNVELIEDYQQLLLEKINDDDIIGLVAGASTPDWMIMEVRKRMSEVGKTPEVSGASESADGVEQSKDVSSKVDEVKEEVAEKAKKVVAKKAKKVVADEVKEEVAEKAKKVVAKKAKKVVADEAKEEVADEAKKVVAKKAKKVVADEVKEEVAEKAKEVVAKKAKKVVADEVKEEVAKKAKEVVADEAKEEVADEAKEVVAEKAKEEAVEEEVDLATLGEEDFLAVLDKTFVTIRKGQVIKGTVVQVTDDDVALNIAYKSDGLIARNELPIEADVSAKDVYKIGDEVEAQVLSMNDGEGRVKLSLKRMQDKIDWQKFLDVHTDDTVYDAKITRAVKSGVMARIGSYEAFIPVSHLSLRFVEDVKEYIGREVKVKIIDINKDKKRFVASLKDILIAEVRAKKQELIESFEKGQKVNGKVKKLTDFGAFVDVGGVDGLLHKLDMSWTMIKHPSDVLQEGQEVEVVILNTDPKKKKISLGLKQLQAKPWDLADEKYPVGSVIKGSVVRITNFGAFISLEPGIDGLVHISQVANRRVERVEDELKLGDEIEAKVMDVKSKDRKISLSIRELLEPEKREEKPRRERTERVVIPPVKEATVTLADFFPKVDE